MWADHLFLLEGWLPTGLERHKSRESGLSRLLPFFLGPEPSLPWGGPARAPDTCMGEQAKYPGSEGNVVASWG